MRAASAVVGCLIGVLLMSGAWTDAPHGCPLGHGPGVPLVDEEQLNHCECAKWLNGRAPARLAFADCSLYERQGNCAKGSRGDMPPPDLIYVDLKLYRCPTCGTIFTEPKP